MFRYETLSITRKNFVDRAIQEFPGITNQITREQINQVMRNHNLSWPQWLTTPDNKQGKSIWGFPEVTGSEGVVVNPVIEETDEEISIRISDTYESLETLVSAVASNTVNSLIVSGAAGIGKSHTVDKILRDVNNGSEYNYVFHKGYCRASHLFRLLWENRHQGMTIVLDDTDAIFTDETALNILKAALEMKQTRRIGWGSEKVFEDQDGEEIPRYFDYEGSIIFLTNKDIRGEVSANNKNSTHLSALESRSLVLDMKIKTKREYLIKIKQTVQSGMLREKGFTSNEESQIMEFVESNLDKFQELSLRMVEKIAALFKSSPKNWEKLCAAVCFK